MKHNLIYSTCALLILCCRQSYAADPPLKIEKSITFITEPLDEEGLPDYFEFVRQKAKAGVTADNNAVVLLWQALGPREIEEEKRAAFFNELDMPEPPEEGKYLIELADEHLGEQGEAAYNHPWQESDFPPLAVWLRANSKPLDLAIEASQRPKFYGPMVAEILEDGPPLLLQDHSMLEGLRAFTRGLCVRATLRAGEGRFAAAHADLMACRRLARHASNQFGIVASLVAIAVEGMADKAHVALLHQMAKQSVAVPEGLLAQMLTDLQSLPPAKEMRRAITYDERLLTLDSALQMIRQPPKSLPADKKNNDWIANRAAYDWNYIFRRLNDDHDLYEKAAYEEDPKRSEAFLDEVNQRVESWSEIGESKALMAQALISPQARSKWQYARTASLLFSPTWAAMVAERRGITKRRLSIVATALATFHAKRGEYPVELHELTPDFLQELPLDPVYEQKFRYFRQKQGYLLYGLGSNAEDDQGTFRDEYEDQTHYVIQGEWTTHAALQAKLDNLSETDPTGESETWEKYEGDDLVIRLPLPEIDWPQAK
ncbi:MAG: hypothetical protein RIB44_17905 [Lacipirellulaceae bacterium]